MARDQHGDREAIRITTASAGRTQDIDRRQRRYVISMAIRTVCFVGAVVAEGWLRWVLVVAALLLPYVAVVMANAASSRSDGFALLGGAAASRRLPPGPGGGDDRGPGGV